MMIIKTRKVCYIHREITDRVPVSEWRWKNVTIDFLYKLYCKRGNYNDVSVIVDQLTKPMHLLHIHEDFTLDNLAESFIFEFVRLCSIPVSIISNHDSSFNSMH